MQYRNPDCALWYFAVLIITFYIVPFTFTDSIIARSKCPRNTIYSPPLDGSNIINIMHSPGTPVVYPGAV